MHCDVNYRLRSFEYKFSNSARRTCCISSLTVSFAKKNRINVNYDVALKSFILFVFV